jgi:glycine cleavage system transcriptional repressor
MRKRFIMTAFGKDRLGFIADVARVIYENGCSLEDSTMTNLSDEFAMIFLVEGEDTGPGMEPLINSLERECRRLEMERGISAFVRPISEVSSTSKKDVKLHTLRVEGLDQAGIVFKISRYLADNGINITHFESRSTPSPQTGAPMYTIHLEFEVAPEADLAKIEEGLAEIGNELNVDITME